MLKVGDKVRVRRWRDMENEYGLHTSIDEAIDCEFVFVKYLKEYCGRCFTIWQIHPDGCILLEDVLGVFCTDVLEDPETGAAVSIT